MEKIWLYRTKIISGIWTSINEILVPVYILTRFFLLVVCFTFIRKVSAQDSTLTYNISLSGAGATSPVTPFWIKANQHGSIPTSGNFGLGKLAIYKIYNPNNPRTFQWSSGVEVVASYGNKSDLFLTDAYLAAKLGKLEILVGQRKATTGITDSLLTSGSLAISGNARPVPVIQISIPKFQPLYFTNDFLAVKASYSDGILNGSNINYGSVRSIPNTYFHQKSIYFKLGQDYKKLNGFIGINHQAIWGGEGKIFPVQEISKAQSYWHTVTGKTYNRMRVGNHFGTIDLALRWRRSKWSYLLYRQNIYETGSLFKVINFSDGLSGLSVKRNKVVKEPYFVFNSFLLEVVFTKNQHNKHPFSELGIFEKGNYYNHFIYANGWSYYGLNMGTPLISETANIRSDVNVNSSEFTNNNRITAFHVGVTATWLNTNILFKGTYSRNFGTFISPMSKGKDQFSLLLNAEKKLKGRHGLALTAALASDIGQLYPNSNGVMIGVRKSGILN